MRTPHPSTQPLQSPPSSSYHLDSAVAVASRVAPPARSASAQMASTAAYGHAVVAVDDAPAHRGSAAAPAGRSLWSSDQLFGDRHEIEIVHGASVYRLRVTSLGKLILTK